MFKKIHHPREKALGGIACGVPTFGMMHAEFVQSLINQMLPINFGMTYFFPGQIEPLRNVRWSWKKQKTISWSEWLAENQPINPPPPWCLEVAEARNIIVEMVLRSNIEWVFFRDDDTVAPPDALIKLFSDKVPYIAGNYPSKQQPPHNLILVDKVLGGYDEWRMGEIVECFATGMGLTLIHSDIFRDIEKKIGRPWYKTVSCPEDNDMQDIAPGLAKMTEDVYFCRKAKHCGYKILCDTGVQGMHLDVHTLRRHFYSPQIGTTVWQEYDGSVQWYPGAENPTRKSNELYAEHVRKEMGDKAPKQPERPVRLDLGCPKGLEIDGFLAVDIIEKADIKGDARSLDWFVQNYGVKPDEIRASHLLEHFQWNEAVLALKSWFRALRPGGQVEVAVPDFTWAAEMAIRYKDLPPDRYWQKLQMVYGAQRSIPDTHRCCFNLGVLTKLMSFAGFDVVDQFHLQYGDTRIQRNAVAIGRKPIYLDTTGEDRAIVRDLTEIRAWYIATFDERGKPVPEEFRQEVIIPDKEPKHGKHKDRPAPHGGGAESGADGRKPEDGRDEEEDAARSPQEDLQRGADPSRGGESGDGWRHGGYRHGQIRPEVLARGIASPGCEGIEKDQGGQGSDGDGSGEGTPLL